MPFPARLLYDDETVALDLRPHWWYFSRQLGAGVLVVAAVIGTASVESDDVRNVLRWPVGVLVLAWAAWLANQYLRWRRTSFAVTDQRVLSRTGLLSRHGVEIPLERITDLDYHQGIWERIIGAGDLVIESAGEEGATRFENVPHPDEVQNEVYRQMQGAAQRTASAGADAIGDAVARALRTAPPPGGGDVAGRIEQLARLRDRGLISADEYEVRKNRLLDEL